VGTVVGGDDDTDQHGAYKNRALMEGKDTFYNTPEVRNPLLP